MVSEMVRFEPGEIVCEEGSLGDRVYIVHSGRVEVSRHGTVLAVMARGNMFGEHALLSGLPRTATVTAIEPTDVEALDREALLERMAVDPVFAMRLLSHLSDMTHRIADEFMRRAREEERESVRDRLAEIEFEGRVDTAN